MSEPTVEQMRRIMDASQRAAVALAEAMQPAVKAMAEFGRKMHAALRRDYERAGMPYGDSDEDMMRWFEERCAEAQRDAEHVAERQAILRRPL